MFHLGQDWIIGDDEKVAIIMVETLKWTYMEMVIAHLIWWQLMPPSESGAGAQVCHLVLAMSGLVSFSLG